MLFYSQINSRQKMTVSYILKKDKIYGIVPREFIEFWQVQNVDQDEDRIVMTTETIEQNVSKQIQQMQQQGQVPVAVMLGHEDWLFFGEQSKVSYTPFGSARRYQPALGGLLLVRVDEMHVTKVVTQAELDAYTQIHQIL